MSFTKLLLVIPPQRFVMEGFRTALIALAGYVHRRMPKLEIDLLDFSTITPNAVRQKLESAIGSNEKKRTLAGISTVTADYQSALSVARTLKDIDRDIVVVFGGHHASADARVILRNHLSEIDFIVHGEGEVSLERLLSEYPYVDGVPGVSFIRDAEFVRNPSAALLEESELDRIPLTYRGGELSAAPGKFDHVTYVSARGCPLACSFCAVSNQVIRAKSVTQVMHDIRELVAMGYSRIAFEDNFFAHSKRRTREICAALIELQADGVSFKWDCQTRVESMDNEETLGLMERSGCEAVYLGVEALNEEALKFLGKTRDPRKYLDRLFERVAPRLLASNIACHINLQFGLPSEDDIQIGQTIRAVKKLGDLAAKSGRTITLFPQLFVVYPGTEHFDRYVAMRDFPADVFESFTAWEAEQKPILTWLGETFAHGAGGLPLGILDRHGLARRHYAIDEIAVARVAEMIDRIDKLTGIRVFRYGDHLVKECPDDKSEIASRDGRKRLEPKRAPRGAGHGGRRGRDRADLGRTQVKRRHDALHNSDCDADVPPGAGRRSK